MNQKIREVKVWLPCLFAWALLSAAVLWPDVFAESVRSSLRLCAEKLIPSVFMFAVLTGYLTENGELPRFLTRFIGRLWGLNEKAAKAAFFALFAGFPTGALCAGNLLKRGQITEEEAGRLVGFCSNAGLAFLFGYVGLGLYGTIRVGICLFISETLSSVLMGLIFAPHGEITASGISASGSAGFVTCIKNACGAMLNVCGFVSFFGALLKGLKVILPPWAEIPAACLLELGNACISCREYSAGEGLLMTAAAVGFTGVCVILQEKALCPCLSLGKLIVHRIYMSALTVLFTFLLRPLFGV